LFDDGCADRAGAGFPITRLCIEVRSTNLSQQYPNARNLQEDLCQRADFYALALFDWGKIRKIAPNRPFPRLARGLIIFVSLRRAGSDECLRTLSSIWLALPDFVGGLKYGLGAVESFSMRRSGNATHEIRQGQQFGLLAHFQTEMRK
jgi:hypothetical protein